MYCCHIFPPRLHNAQMHATREQGQPQYIAGVGTEVDAQPQAPLRDASKKWSESPCWDWVSVEVQILSPSRSWHDTVRPLSPKETESCQGAGHCSSKIARWPWNANSRLCPDRWSNRRVPCQLEDVGRESFGMSWMCCVTVLLQLRFDSFFPSTNRSWSHGPSWCFCSLDFFSYCMNCMYTLGLMERC